LFVRSIIRLVIYLFIYINDSFNSDHKDPYQQKERKRSETKPHILQTYDYDDAVVDDNSKSNKLKLWCQAQQTSPLFARCRYSTVLDGAFVPAI